MPTERNRCILQVGRVDHSSTPIPAAPNCGEQSGRAGLRLPSVRTQVVVTAKTAGSSSLVLWDESSNARIVDVYADVDVAGLREGVRSAYPDEPVEIEAEQGRVSLPEKSPAKRRRTTFCESQAFIPRTLSTRRLWRSHREKQVMLKVRFLKSDVLNWRSSVSISLARELRIRSGRSLPASFPGTPGRATQSEVFVRRASAFDVSSLMKTLFLFPSGLEPGCDDSGS